MTMTDPRWLKLTAAERRAYVQPAIDANRRKALNRRIDDLVEGARLLSPEQKVRLAA
jgi:hypothetical protein